MRHNSLLHDSWRLLTLKREVSMSKHIPDFVGITGKVIIYTGGK